MASLCSYGSVRFSSIAALLALAGLLGTAGVVRASAPDYALVPKESELRFVGRQQGAPFTGRFTTFTAQVAFDPADPQAGRISAEVDVRSADSQNRDRDEYMQARDFFYSRKHPRATFETTAIAASDDEAPTYVAKAQLTLRGKTREVTMRFTFEQTSAGGAHLVGSVPLKRLDFGIGQGEWQDTSEIGDEVRVEIDLILAPGQP